MHITLLVQPPVGFGLMPPASGSSPPPEAPTSGNGVDIPPEPAILLARFLPFLPSYIFSEVASEPRYEKGSLVPRGYLFIG